MLGILFPGIKEGQYTLLIILSCISVALWLLIAVARWRMFTKMGEAGWKAFVPFYGLYIFLIFLTMKTNSVHMQRSEVLGRSAPAKR